MVEQYKFVSEDAIMALEMAARYGGLKHPAFSNLFLVALKLLAERDAYKKVAMHMMVIHWKDGNKSEETALALEKVDKAALQTLEEKKSELGSEEVRK